MNTASVQPNRKTEQDALIDELVLDALHDDVRIAHGRIAELEADNRALRELLHLTLDRLRYHMTRSKQATERLRALTATATQIRKAA
jgi:hypothetical protein